MTLSPERKLWLAKFRTGPIQACYAVFSQNRMEWRLAVPTVSIDDAVCELTDIGLSTEYLSA